jgi:hypothetical protein
MATTQTEDKKKRPDPFDPRIGTGRESEPSDPLADDDSPDLDADDVPEGDGKELGG